MKRATQFSVAWMRPWFFAFPPWSPIDNCSFGHVLVRVFARIAKKVLIGELQFLMQSII